MPVGIERAGCLGQSTDRERIHTAGGRAAGRAYPLPVYQAPVQGAAGCDPQDLRIPEARGRHHGATAGGHDRLGPRQRDPGGQRTGGDRCAQQAAGPFRAGIGHQQGLRELGGAKTAQDHQCQNGTERGAEIAPTGVPE